VCRGHHQAAEGSKEERPQGDQHRQAQDDAHMPKKTRTALGKQASAVRKRKRTGASTPKTRAELIKIARRRGLEGRSKMGRDELARALGEK
jgi:hypothetical protein